MFLKKLLIVLLLSMFVNCYGHYSTSPYLGLVVSNAGHHIRHTAGGRTLGNGAIEKRGEECITNYLVLNGIFHNRSSNSVKKAMEKAKITKIAVVDHYSTQIFPASYTIYSKDCTVVWGE
jgi:hypothetical protein